MAIVICRARLAHNCLHGLDERSVYGEATMASDGTWDGHTVICTTCYVRLMPYTPDGMGMLKDLPQAIRLYRDAQRPMAERIEKFTKVNESEEGVTVLREDLPDGAVKLHVLENGMPEALALLVPGKPIRWL